MFVRSVPQEAVSLTPLIYPANSFWLVRQPQLISCCESVPTDLILLGTTQPDSRTVASRFTIAGAAGGV